LFEELKKPVPKDLINKKSFIEQKKQNLKKIIKESNIAKPKNIKKKKHKLSICI